ncbi:glycerate kinase [Caldinitratiruptor microaerophilus]|uniref:Glycerate kinase n=2 Tax=Caldinitratiruptor microaerophilus TaxID=671077 RepID=A0AA35G6X2_9FIRM|nr:glycerate kinase [Caldinitratiruptor microaerophilus]
MGMRVVIAPDSFKGSLSAIAAAEAMAAGVRRVFPEAETVLTPLADGGEGTVDAILAATGGERIRVTVTGPLGDPVDAFFGIVGGGRTAVIEMAAASGLTLVPPERRDPRRTTTRGTGELIRAALDRGCREIVLGIGGSATNDGGAGMAQALGARLLDRAGREIGPGGAELARLERIDVSGLDPRLRDVRIRVACDVDNPLTGPRGASAVYGPQKGATPEMIAELDAALGRWGEILARDLGREVSGVPGAGAAGGLGAGLLAVAGARLERGIDLVMDTVGFERRLEDAWLVLTGEGRTDAQTLHGKVPLGVARAAVRRGVPVVVISGSLGPGAEALLDRGVSALLSIVPGPIPEAEAMARAAEFVTEATARALRLVRLGADLTSRAAHPWRPAPRP